MNGFPHKSCIQGSPILYSFQSICENKLNFFLNDMMANKNKQYYEARQLTKNLFLQSNA